MKTQLYTRGWTSLLYPLFIPIAASSTTFNLLSDLTSRTNLSPLLSPSPKIRPDFVVTPSDLRLFTLTLRQCLAK